MRPKLVSPTVLLVPIFANICLINNINFSAEYRSHPRISYEVRMIHVPNQKNLGGQHSHYSSCLEGCPRLQKNIGLE